MNAYWQLVLANYRGFVRDRAALFWTIAFPVLFIVIFGLIFGRDEGTEYPVGLVVQDQSAQTELVSEVLSNVDAFALTKEPLDIELNHLREGDRSAVVVIPEGFGASVESGESKAIRIHFDPTQQIVNQVVVPVLMQALEVADRTLTNSVPVIRTEFETLQSESLGYIDFIIPGIVAMSVMQLGMYGSINMVSMRERRVLRRLQATPLRRATLVAADVTVRLGLTLLQTAILVGLGWAVFGVQVVGNLGLLALIVLLGVLVFLAIGFFVAAFTRTEQSFFPVAQAVVFPMMFLSGIFFPVDSVPDWLQPIVSAFPLTYLGDAVRQTMVGGAGLNPMWLNLVVLAAYGLVFFGGAVRFFRWE